MWWIWKKLYDRSSAVFWADPIYGICCFIYYKDGGKKPFKGQTETSALLPPQTVYSWSDVVQDKIVMLISIVCPLQVS